MQTFITDLNFCRTAKQLDYRRLGKQRVEGFQLWKGQWPNHPASKMWKNYKNALALYTNIIIEEWISRGYKNTMELLPVEYPITYPWWYVDSSMIIKVIDSHRSNLLRKDFTYYNRYNWNLPNNLPYVWPGEYNV